MAPFSNEPRPGTGTADCWRGVVLGDEWPPVVVEGGGGGYARLDTAVVWVIAGDPLTEPRTGAEGVNWFCCCWYEWLSG